MRFSKHLLLITLVLSPLTAYVNADDFIIDKQRYHEQLKGFWLGQSIANWTGLVTEMDKIGGEGIHGKFYRRDDWGKADQPSIWGQGIPSDLSKTIDWVLETNNQPWGSDDDTDIEYMYQFLLHQHQTTRLSATQIRDGWMKHIYSDANTPFTTAEGKPENYLWVANQTAHDLMRLNDMLPPETGQQGNNPHFDMIDAQLSTEIFGLFAPYNQAVALTISELPIRTVADKEALIAAQFYVILHSQAVAVDIQKPIQPQLERIANRARKHLPDESYLAHMFDDVYQAYKSNEPWEEVRDDLYQTYQVSAMHGYNITSRDLYCNGCFAAGINFGASLISYFYGEGDYKETVKLAVLMGWDSDNPAATWGGLLGFIYGYQHLQDQFAEDLSIQFNIHRTRGGFPSNGLDNFDDMATVGLAVTERVIVEEMNGVVQNTQWVIPKPNQTD